MSKPSEKTHIYFVRHARPNYDNRDDLSRELSEKGLKDRKLVTTFLSDKSIDMLMSSPFKRAYDTIKDFADCYNYEIRVVDDFQERKIDDCWIEDFESFCRKQWEDFDYKLTNGETLRECQKRNITALNQILLANPGNSIAIGSHGTAMSTIINYYQPAFDFSTFQQVRHFMPWIVHFTFEGQICIKIESHNLFTNEVREFLNK